jgi:hypothetical protein
MAFVNGLTIHVVMDYGNNIVSRSHKFLMDWENKEVIQDLNFQIDAKVKWIVLIVESAYKDGCIKTLHINFMIDGETINHPSNGTWSEFQFYQKNVDNFILKPWFSQVFELSDQTYKT